MRTPGRCTNTEGCWISASRRDVWAVVGEEFVCPNCGNPLVPPEGKALSMRGLRRVALLSTIFIAVLAAGSFAAVRLSPLAVATVRPVLAALLRAPRAVMADRLFAPQPNAATPPRGAAPAAPPAAPPAHVADRQPAPTQPSSPPPRQFAVLTPGVTISPKPAPSGHVAKPPSAPGVVLYSAIPDAVTLPQQGTNPPHAAPQSPGDQADHAGARQAEPAPVVTTLSEASLVVLPSAQPPVILPVTFGRPVAPENDAEPVRLHWRYHGLVAAAPRRSVFRSEPSDSVEAMCRTLEPLQ